MPDNPRDYPARPWIGVGVVVWRKDDVLLIQRGKEPRAGTWSIPGGMQELGETVREAGIREVFEETGVAVAIDGMIDVIDVVIPDSDGKVRTHYTLVDFCGHWLHGDIRPGDDAADARWVNINDIGEFGLWSETDRIIRKSRKHLG